MLNLFSINVIRIHILFLFVWSIFVCWLDWKHMIIKIFLDWTTFNYKLTTNACQIGNWRIVTEELIKFIWKNTLKGEKQMRCVWSIDKIEWELWMVYNRHEIWFLLKRIILMSGIYKGRRADAITMIYQDPPFHVWLLG